MISAQARVKKKCGLPSSAERELCPSDTHPSIDEVTEESCPGPHSADPCPAIITLTPKITNSAYRLGSLALRMVFVAWKGAFRGVPRFEKNSTQI